MPRHDLSLDEACRLALAAQGFHRRRPAQPDASHLRRTLGELHLLQIDYVNVLGPAQYQVPFSRLGPYDRSTLDRLIYRRREFTEHWAHEASILPTAHWPLLRHRMAAHRTRPRGFERLMTRHRAYVDRVLDAVTVHGPIGAHDLPAPPAGFAPETGAWRRSVQRNVLEAYFGRGLLAVAERLANFARTYDLAERIVPAEHFGRHVGAADAQRELLHLAARAHGVGTAADIADYYRMSVRDARPRLAELVEAGVLEEVRIERWRETAYLDPKARLPRCIDAAALLSPFDPLVWHRPRTLRLYGFEFKLEIFVPASKRRWGYYVLPFLLGERLVARVDLKADRAQRTLRVAAAHLEPGAHGGAVAEALSAELFALGRWYGLEAVAVGRRGNLARRLSAAVRRSA